MKSRIGLLIAFRLASTIRRIRGMLRPFICFKQGSSFWKSSRRKRRSYWLLCKWVWEGWCSTLWSSTLLSLIHLRLINRNGMQPILWLTNKCLNSKPLMLNSPHWRSESRLKTWRQPLDKQTLFTKKLWWSSCWMGLWLSTFRSPRTFQSYTASSVWWRKKSRT